MERNETIRYGIFEVPTRGSWPKARESPSTSKVESNLLLSWFRRFWSIFAKITLKASYRSYLWKWILTISHRCTPSMHWNLGGVNRSLNPK
jgi:hypothetical protein